MREVFRSPTLIMLTIVVVLGASLMINKTQVLDFEDWRLLHWVPNLAFWIAFWETTLWSKVSKGKNSFVVGCRGGSLYNTFAT